MDELLHIVATIRDLLVTTIHGHSYTHVEILEAYQCTMTDNIKNFTVPDAMLSTTTLSDVRQVLRDIESAFNISTKRSSTTNLTIDSPGTTSSHTDQDRSDWIYLCAYFLKYPSKIFGEMKYDNTIGSYHYPDGYWPRVPDFIRAVTKKRREIEQTIGDRMIYARVSNALSNHLTTTAMIDTEWDVLMNCEMLHITTSDISNFRTLKILFDFAQPLQNFVQCCIQYQFHNIVQQDATFQALQIAVTKFYSTVHHSLDNCLSFFDCLYDIFCPQPTFQPPSTDNSNNGTEETKAELDSSTLPSYSVVLHKIDELSKVLSWLMPLTYASYGSNIWQFVVNDMNWSGNDGYLKFQERHDKIYNALMRYSLSNELSVLRSVQPVVHLFSTIGQYKDCSNTIHELLQNFQNNSDIQNCMSVPSIEHHIHEVNGRINAIQDLFSKSVDANGSVCGHAPTKILTLTLGSCDTTSEQTPPFVVTYGSVIDEQIMRRWLDEHLLPANVGDFLVSLGIRTMDDVRMMSMLDENEINEMISTLPKMDRMKLLNQLTPIMNATATGSTNDATNHTATASAKKRKASGMFFQWNN